MRDGAVLVVAVRRFPESVKLTYENADGVPGSRMLLRVDEAKLSLERGGAFGRPFDGDGEDLRLVSEAMRIDLAHLFDPYLAVNASAVEPLPHQIEAVYGEMLGRQTLRYLLADDPGAGKTIMTGLFVKELMIRGDLERCLIVAPGNLVEQWRFEMREKFGLTFSVLGRRDFEAGSGELFGRHPLAIARLDVLSRSDELQGVLGRAGTLDLVVVDEAHKMSASYIGGKADYTKRFHLGKRLAGLTRHFLLLSATPHNGKQDDFELFMSLLDADRFEGRIRDRESHTATSDVSDLMRRRLKEELLRFDGTPLFPERYSYTVNYALSESERDLYERVTSYVREEMNRAERFAAEDDKRRLNVGFALQILQRRLASSPEAIHRSLVRRRERLSKRLAHVEGEMDGARRGVLGDVDVSEPNLAEGFWDDLDDAPEDEVERAEAVVLDRATASRTAAELRTEIATLGDLEELARRVRRSGRDSKWTQLDRILDDPLMTDPAGNRRKLIVFTEARDTLAYLAERIRTRLGRPEAVVEIHGGVGGERRQRAVESFVNDPATLVLVANDAAGEGVNLQRAHLMVNYDLPWNPNRLEQRFGRIHRIGQREVCHLWNLVASDTREGEVYGRLLEKLEVEREALGGRVYDVLGRLFEERPLRELLLEAVRYGDREDVKARLDRVVDGAVDRGHIEELLTSRALVRETVDATTVRAAKEEMERAEARRLQPHFIRSFLLEAFARLGGVVRRRESGRWEITRVPYAIRQRAGELSSGTIVGERYERVCFDRSDVSPGHQAPEAVLIAPGHPLLDAVTDLTLERYRDTLERGAVLVDEGDRSEDVRTLFYLEHTVHDGVETGSALTGRGGEGRVISRQLRFVEVSASGDVSDAGSAPYLDYRPLSEEERGALGERPGDFAGDMRSEDVVMDFAASFQIPAHLSEVGDRRLPEIGKVEREVTARLRGQINYWDHRAETFKERERAGKRTPLSSFNAAATAEELAGRLDARLERLAREREIYPAAPIIRGAALIVPGGLIARLTGHPEPAARDEVDVHARRAVELAAMWAVMSAERSLGNEPTDVSDRRGIGYDIESRDPETGGLRFIEVKGRWGEGGEITLTKNEILCSRNEPGKFRLAIVVVGEEGARTPRYLHGMDFGEPAFAETSRSFGLKALLERSEEPK